MSTIDVRLKPAWIENVGYRYDVILDGETIVRRSRDPEHDAARALHARGRRGCFRTIDFFTGRPRMILDIEKAAKLRIIERDDTGLTVVPYRPMSEEDKTRARLHRAHQGGVILEGTVPSTREADKPAGDESGVTKHAPPPVTECVRPKTDRGAGPTPIPEAAELEEA